MAINYESTRQTLRGLPRAGVQRLVFASSCSVYGANGNDFLHEDSHLNPVSLYARTRLMSEELLLRNADRRRGGHPASGDRLRRLAAHALRPHGQHHDRLRAPCRARSASPAPSSGARTCTCRMRPKRSAWRSRRRRCGGARSSTSAPTSRTSPSARSPRRSPQHDSRDADRVRTERRTIRAATASASIASATMLGFRAQRTVDDAIDEVGGLLSSGAVRGLPNEQFHNAKWLSANGTAARSRLRWRARLRVGLVGCGRIARVHRAYLQGICRRSSWSASATPTPAARRAFAQRGRAARRSPRVAELLEQRPAGRGARADAAGQPRAAGDASCCRPGVNVLVEKPLAMNAAEADQVDRRGAPGRALGDGRPQSLVRSGGPGGRARRSTSGRLGQLVGVDVFQGAEVGEAEKQAVRAHALERAAARRGAAQPGVASALPRCAASPARCATCASSRARVGGAWLEEVRLIGRRRGGAWRA